MILMMGSCLSKKTLTLKASNYNQQHTTTIIKNNKKNPGSRLMIKICTLESLSHTKINSFRSMREQELDLLIKFIREAANDGTTVDISAKVAALTADMTCIIVFGKKYSDKDLNEKGFKASMQELMSLAATPNIGALESNGLKRRMKAINKIFDEFLEKIIDEHIQSKNKDDNKTKDFVEVMLGFVGTEESDYRIERSNIFLKTIIVKLWQRTLYVPRSLARRKIIDEDRIMSGFSSKQRKSSTLNECGIKK